MQNGCWVNIFLFQLKLALLDVFFKVQNSREYLISREANFNLNTRKLIQQPFLDWVR